MSKSPAKVAINGFGRIGRKVLRLALSPSASSGPDVEVVAINDLGSLETLAHLLKYDSVHGTLPEDVRTEGDSIFVGAKRIRCTSEKDPSRLPWKELEVGIVHECTGVFRDQKGAGLHLNAGAQRVIISAPAKDPDGTFCMGVNHESYDPAQHKIVSNASCTTNCLAPLVKVLDDAFGVEHGTMLTVHSYTNDQRILDLPHSDLRRARAAAVSMIPTSTGAAKAVGLVLPQLKGKLDGLAIRVPTPNVSLVDFTGKLKKSTTRQEINEAFKAASEGPLQGILGFSEEPLVSCDFNGNTASSTVDADATTVMEGTLVKVISWYDNESGFSQRMLDFSAYMADRGL